MVWIVFIGLIRVGWMRGPRFVLCELNDVCGQVVDRLENNAPLSKFGLKFCFADAPKPKSISKEVLGLVFGGNDDFKAVVSHWYRWLTVLFLSLRLHPCNTNPIALFISWIALFAKTPAQ
jgi:hypothetical protein